MTKKELMEFAKEKFELIKKIECKKYQDVIDNFKELDNEFDRVLREEMRNKALEVSKRANFVKDFNPDKISISIYDSVYNIEETKEVKEARVQINNIKNKVENEKIDFVDRVMILGLKDETVREMLLELSARSKEVK